MPASWARFGYRGLIGVVGVGGSSYGINLGPGDATGGFGDVTGFSETTF